MPILTRNGTFTSEIWQNSEFPALYRRVLGPSSYSRNISGTFRSILSRYFASRSSNPGTGPGGRIVAEVFIGLLENDSRSFLSKKPGWEPREDLNINGKFDVSALLTTAGVA